MDTQNLKAGHVTQARPFSGIICFVYFWGRN